MFSPAPRKLLLLTVVILATVARASVGDSPAPPPAAGEVIAKSIAYHDPSGVWDTGRIRLGLFTTYSEEFAKKRGRRDAGLVLVLSPGHEEFSYTREAGDDRIEITLMRGEGTVTVNGSTDVSEADRERLRLAEPELYRNYSEYLYLMPMKLRDPGTRIEPDAREARFNDRDVWQVRVTYDPEVGEDTWYFYFDRTTFALVGYRFYKDESKNDGEYITFEGEIFDKSSGLRLPKIRAWYFNADDGHLATDDIMSISTSGG